MMKSDSYSAVQFLSELLIMLFCFSTMQHWMTSYVWDDL